jgi:hypothetical protein
MKTNLQNKFPLKLQKLNNLKYRSKVGAGIAQSVWRLVTGWTTEGSEFASPGGGKNFLFSTSSRPALGSTQPPIQWVPGALSMGVKRPGREADHSPSTSVEVKKIWIYTFTPPYAFKA